MERHRADPGMTYKHYWSGRELIIRHFAAFDKVVPWKAKARRPEYLAWMLAHYWYVEISPERVSELFGVN